MSGYGCARHLGEEHVGTLVAGKKLLHVIRSRPIGVMRIEPNQVGSPLPSLYMREEGRISSQTNHIGIALITRHDSSLTQSGCEAVLRLEETKRMASIFAGKHLRPLAGELIVARSGIQAPLGRAVKMLVYKIHLEGAHFAPHAFKLLTFRRGSRRTNHLNIRIFLPNLLSEQFQSGRYVFAPLLVSDSQILEVERRRMAHLSAKGCPFVFGGVAIRKLNQVKRIVNIRLKLREGHKPIAFLGDVIYELASHTAVQHRQRSSTNLLREEEILVESKAVRLIIVRRQTTRHGIAPFILVERPILYRPYGVLPLIPRLERIALNDAASGKTEHTGMEVSEGLRQVSAKAVFMTIERIHREEAHMIDFHRATAEEQG